MNILYNINIINSIPKYWSIRKTIVSLFSFVMYKVIILNTIVFLIILYIIKKVTIKFQKVLA